MIALQARMRTLTRFTINLKRFKHFKPHKALINEYFEQPYLKAYKHQIPSQYLELKRFRSVDTLYLVDYYVAQTICQHILPILQKDDQHLIAETAPGLALITKELLKNDVKRVRMYEACAEFQYNLHNVHDEFQDRVELYKKNLFHIYRISNLDKYEKTNRVAMLLKDVPRRSWHEYPSITIIGAMVNLSFIHYLLKMMAMQAEITTYGRVQIFAMMRPSDYVKLTAGPEHNLHTYRRVSILFRTLFNCNLLDKLPRKAFLPWETKFTITSQTQYASKIDMDKMYLVHITTKNALPITQDEILPFYFFVRQLFGNGNNRVIPTLEKWIPGCGLYAILPTMSHKNFFNDMTIYTRFGELAPHQIVSVFKEVIKHDTYEQSAFTAMIEAELLKYESSENDNTELLEETLENYEHIYDELEEDSTQ